MPRYDNQTILTWRQPAISLHILSFDSIADRIAKCHGYDGSTRVKMIAGWGKKSERTHNLAKISLY